MRCMKTMLYAMMAATLACATIPKEKMYCYKYGSCGEKNVVTERTVNIEYVLNRNNEQQWILVKDKLKHRKYRLVRNEANNKLELESLVQGER